MDSKEIFGTIESASGFTRAQQIKLAISLLVIVISIPLTTYFGALRYQQLKTKAANYYSILFLVPVVEESVYPGNTFSVEIHLNTGDISGVPAETDATDVVLHYDNSKFIATSVSPGTIYSTYIGQSYTGSGGALNAIDQASGTITLSGIAFNDTPGTEQPTSPFAGTGIFATINFQVRSDLTEAAVSDIYFDWGLNSSTCTTGTLDERKACTTDTNVAQHGTAAEILNDAQPAAISIAFVCNTGQTRTCTAANGCEGTQACANQNWGTCTTDLIMCSDNVCLADCGECVPDNEGTCTASNGCSGTRVCGSDRLWGGCTTDLTRCGDGTCQLDCGECTPGNTQDCSASNGCPGSQACGADREWGTCETTLDYCAADDTCQVDCGECVPDDTQACETSDHFSGTETCGTDRYWSGVCVPGLTCAAGYTKCSDGTCQVECPPEVARGDFNNDGVVNSFDLAILFNEWNISSPEVSVCDLNGDDFVNSFDLAIFWTLW